MSCKCSIRNACSRMAFALFAFNAALVHAADTAVKTPVGQVPPLQVQPLAGGGLAKIGFGLLIVVGLIVALSWAARRMGGLTSAGAGSLRILGGLSMGTRERVVLIQVGEKQLLLGVAPGRVQTLHVLDEPIATGPAAGSSQKGGFAANLSAALRQGRTS